MTIGYIFGFGLGWGEFVVCFICFGIPAIIVLLIVKNIQKKKLTEQQNPTKDDAHLISDQDKHPQENKGETTDVKGKLQEYDAMKNKGLISEEDYEALKRKLLDL